jgi:predicted metal-dependent hydrolase
VLEDLWLDNDDESRLFYQGLIHLATAYQHLWRANMQGSIQRFESTLKYLSAYPACYEGLELTPIRQNISTWLQRIAVSAPHAARYVDVDVPQLSLV